ncbi:MAG: pyruvate kinase, partial [Alphaproteobacteria bacterium]|nr:pyruvate kinase [Alphaproteobacteria bacterium]
MPRFTKITASIGPNCQSREVLSQMIKSGVNVCRLNFSHDTGIIQGEKIDLIRSVSKELGIPVAVMIDIQGPKHRIGDFETENHYPLTVGQKFILDSNNTPGNEHRVYLPDIDIIKSVNIGDRILLNDGKIELNIDAVFDDSIETTVVRGTEIWSRRGINFPDTEINTNILTQKDMEDLEYVITKQPDWIAVSFVQKAEDISFVRDFITQRTSHPIKILAKIERPNAIERITDIAFTADAVMIARGDLAVEIPFEQVPAVSRKIVRECRMLNRPVLMATQMLSSMVDNDFPTRAEISDVANTAYLRADSAMTSEETTIGKNPVNVIKTMNKILAFADKDAIENPYDWSRLDNLPENDWSRSVSSIAYLNKASAIIVFA